MRHLHDRQKNFKAIRYSTGMHIQTLAGPDGLGRKNFKIWTQ